MTWRRISWHQPKGVILRSALLFYEKNVELCRNSFIGFTDGAVSVLSLRMLLVIAFFRHGMEKFLCNFFVTRIRDAFTFGLYSVIINTAQVFSIQLSTLYAT